MIYILYLRRIGDDPQAQILLNRFMAEGFVNLKYILIEKVFRLEGITTEQTFRLKPLLCNPVSETISDQTTLNEKEAPIIEVGYQRAVTDPELPSILRGARALGINDLTWARISNRYQFFGIDKTAAEQIVTRHLYNPQVQIILSAKETWTTLRPQSKAGPVEQIVLKNLDRKKLLHLSETRRLFLNHDQMSALQKISLKMNRPLTDTELEMFAQTWSDHCFHTTWKSLGLLQFLWKTTNQVHHPLVLSVFEDNAGVMEFYEGYALTIKGETHNSPTAISPYGGIMTKHGGVIRDTLGCGQGAWPIGGSTIMGLGDPLISWSEVPKGALHPKTILVESIRGTADYTNPMGIPMMFPVYRFHPGYTGKCFALGHSIGIIPAKRGKKGRPKPGDLAILIGGETGRDGLHGATVSSGSMTSETATVDAAHVQIGHPIQERKFMEAIPVLRDSNCLRAITDLGAAGLSSAAGEMGEKTGVWINLAWVPLKTEGMQPWEIWISESQERMLLCVPPDMVDKALSILKRYEVPAAIIGKFTDTHRCQVVLDESKTLEPKNLLSCPELTGIKVVDLDFKDLRKGCPLPQIEVKKPKEQPEPFTPSPLKSQEQWICSINAVLGHLNICDQSPAGTQFDSTVQGITVNGPYGGNRVRMPNDIWVSTPIRGKTYGAAAAIGYNPFYGEIDPAGAVRLMMIEPVTKLIAAGVRSDEIVLCDNFYTPKVSSETAWILKEMVLSCCELSRELRIPFVSGKDSSSGTFVSVDGKKIEVPPTLCILALGRMPDVRKMIQKPWKTQGSSLFIVGPLSKNLGGSIYLDTLNRRGDVLPEPSIELIKETWETLNIFQKKGFILSASAIAEGGLIRRLFEIALGSGLGCRIDLSDLSDSLQTDQPEIGLFSEMIGAILIEVQKKNVSMIKESFKAVPVGQVVKEASITLDTGLLQPISLSLDELITIWEKPFREIVQ